MMSQSHIFPVKLGAKMDAVLPLIASSIFAESILKVNGSMSTNTGIRLFFTRHPTVVENVNEGVMTSDPFGRFSDATPT